MLTLFLVMTPKTACVFGIDPGLARFGWAAIERQGPRVRLVEAGRLTTPAGQADPIRLHSLYKKFTLLLREFHPSQIVVEKLFFSKNVSTAMAVGQARGIALLAAAEFGIPISEFTPTAIKQAVTGYGRADKRQVQTMITTLLRLKKAPQSDDVADAIAAALCGAQALHV